MLKTVLLQAFLLVSTFVSAQNYASMWKSVQDSRDKDQPKTALSHIQKIEKKAEKERSYGNLFAALFTEVTLQQEISPDSMVSMRKRLMAKEAQLRTTDGVASTVFRTILWKYGYALFEEEQLAEAAQYKPSIDSLLQSKDAARYTEANSAPAYLPLVERHEGSKYFNHDLLSLIGYETEQFEALRRHYFAQENREAVAILDQRLFDMRGGVTTKEEVEWIDSMLNVWGKWEGVNGLRMRRQSLTLPMCQVQFDYSAFRTNQCPALKVSQARNIHSATVTFTRLSCAAKTIKDQDVDDEAYAKLRKYLVKGSEKSFSKTFAAHLDYESFADTIIIEPLPLGLYLVEITTDCKTMQPTRAIVWVSDLKVIMLALPDNKMRAVVVNAVDGSAVGGAVVHVKQRNGEAEQTYTTGKDGECIIPNQNNSHIVYATTAEDNAVCPLLVYSTYSNFIVGQQRGTSNHLNVYTDRKIYRPGQVVKIAVLASSVTDGKEWNVRPNAKLELGLRDASYKEIAKQSVVTDEYGVASCEFTLPEHTKNGTFAICIGNLAKQQIRVEEYVRPTFDVTIDRPEVAYSNGDTVAVRGVAKTYSGVPIAGARVAYSVTRKNAWWWRPYYMAREAYPRESELLVDTVTTAADGSFTLRMPMIVDEKQGKYYACFHNIMAEATVTDLAGESHSASISLPLSNREAYLSCDLPAKICADEASAVTNSNISADGNQPLNITINRRNAAGELVDGIVSIAVDGGAQTEIAANKPFPLSVASGKHTLTAICKGDTLKQEFTVFRLTDQHPIVETHDWWYEAKDGRVQFGTSDHKKVAYYCLTTTDKVLESGTVVMDSALTVRDLSYKPEYGECVNYSIAWVHEGQLYSHSIQIKPELPSKKLTMEWGTFRNRLEPGQKETWTLHIKNPDGTPAKAQLLATLYDKSLDAIVNNTWSLSDFRSRAHVNTAWRSPGVSGLYLNVWANQPSLNLRSLDFSCFNGNYMPMSYYRPMRYRGNARPMLLAAKSTNSVMMVGGADDEAKVFDCVETSSMLKGSIAGQSSDAADTPTEAAEADVAVRENFAETAFFMPQIMTDDNGIAAVEFTLPESVTTWKFMGLAHTTDMKNAILTDECVAQKSLMVQPRVPRFVREGDVVDIPATVSNLSDKEQSVKVVLKACDAATDKVLFTFADNVKVKAGETVPVSFVINTRNVPAGVEALTVTVTAKSASFSDGEKHLMPILPNSETVVNTLPVLLREKGNADFDITSLIPSTAENAKVQVTYNDNPQWLLIDALPYVTDAIDDNAVSLAAAYYSNALGAYVCEGNELLQNRYDKAALTYRAQDFIERLSKLQNGDGAWSWWRGMYPSRYMTMEVMKMLVRINTITGNDAAKQLINRGYKYLDSEIAKEIKEMKKYEKKGDRPSLSSFAVDYLYCEALSKRNNNADYLVKFLAESTVKTDMATKAEAAVVLNHFGKTQKADEFAQSIIEHTVYRNDIGRYFDSPRAAYSWCNYRIPTQAMVIEALSSYNIYKVERAEMQRWLLQSKRTQQWDTPINAVNAIHAFFGGSAKTLVKSEPATIRLDRKVMATEGEATSKGITTESVDVRPGKHTVSIDKASECESWGAVAVTFRQKQSDIEAMGSGMTINRVLLDSKGKPISTQKTLNVGDKVKVLITVKADRDYDFVTITDHRAACLEPLSQLSGYRNGAYIVQHDTETSYCYNQLSKGEHRIEVEYYVSRAGKYTVGTATATCTYAPEFTGRTTSEVIDVKK